MSEPIPVPLEAATIAVVVELADQGGPRLVAAVEELCRRGHVAQAVECARGGLARARADLDAAEEAVHIAAYEAVVLLDAHGLCDGQPPTIWSRP